MHCAGRVGPPEAGPARANYLLVRRNDDRLQDLVGEGLALLVPEREQVADAEEAVKDVAQVAQERLPGADRLPGVLADQLDVQLLLAERLALAAENPAVVDAPADRAYEEEEVQEESEEPVADDGRQDEEDNPARDDRRRV